MILVDANILVYAVDSDSPHHARSRRWLEEALGIVRGMLDGTRPTVAGERYRTEAVLNLPPPVHRIPILIGGSGPKVTLRLVAQYADMNNLGNPVETCLRNDAILVEHCHDLGRDEREIERRRDLRIADALDPARDAGCAKTARRGHAAFGDRCVCHGRTLRQATAVR